MPAGVNTLSSYVIALCQQKGGVGKTTTTASLGAELAKSGTSSLGLNIDQLASTTEDLFRSPDLPDNLILPTPIEGLHLIPANLSLLSIPSVLYKTPNYEMVLLEKLSHPTLSKYDVIILDCPPGMNVLSMNAIASANLAIFPVVCEFFALQTLENMFRLVKLSRERANPMMSYRLLISQMDERISLHHRIYEQIQTRYPKAILKTVIDVSEKIPQSQLAGVPISMYDPDSTPTRQFTDLSKEIIEIINGVKETND